MLPEEVWSIYEAKLKRFIIQHVSDSYEAEDILQDVGVRLQQHQSMINSIENVEGWLYHVTKNLIVDYYRKKNRYSLTDDMEALTAAETAESDNYNQETAVCLLVLVNNLSPTDRDAIMSSDYYGEKQRMLGQKWGLSYSGSKNRVQRARKKLRSKLLSCCEVKSDKAGNIIEFFHKGNDEFNCIKC